MINLLIAGYHGYGNCGDEATLSAMSTNIKSIADDVSICAISHNPLQTKTEYSIESVQRFNAIEVIKAILKSDIILSGGGTLIQNETSTRSLLYYLTIIKFAKLFNKKVMLYANGIGPVKGSFNRKLVKFVVNSVDIITLREEFSEEDLKSMGVDRPEIYVTADATFTLKGSSKQRAIDILQAEEIPMDKDIIGVAIRNWSKAKGGDDYTKELAKTLDKLVEKGKTILLIPMQFPKDIEISKKLMNEMEQQSYILKNPYSPKEIASIIGQTKLIIGMRLHSLIFSAVEKVPMIGVIYDPKVEYYLDVLGMPYAGDVRSEYLDSNKIINKIEGMFFDLEKYKDILEEKVTILIEKANQNEKLLDKYLQKIRNSKK